MGRVHLSNFRFNKAVVKRESNLLFIFRPRNNSQRLNGSGEGLVSQGL